MADNMMTGLSPARAERDQASGAAPAGAGDAGVRRHWGLLRDLVIAAALAAIMLRFMWVHMLYMPLNVLDEGYHVYVAQQLIRGKTLYRDLFTLYPPGYHWFDALAMLTLGMTVFSTRVFRLYTLPLKPALAFLLSRTFLALPYAIAAGCATLVWGDNRLQVSLALLALLCVAAWERRPQAGWLWLAGVVAAGSALYKHEFGVFALFGCALLALLLNRRRQAPSRARAVVGPLAGGFAIIIVPVLALVAARGALTAMILQLGPVAMQTIHANSLPYPAWVSFPFRDFWANGHLAVRELYYAFEGALNNSYNFYIFPALLVTAVVFFAWRWRTRRWERSDDYALTVWLLSVLAFPIATQRSDIGHLHGGTPYITILAAWQVQTLVGAVRGSGASVRRRAAATAVAVILLLPAIVMPLNRFRLAVFVPRPPLPPPLQMAGIGPIRGSPQEQHGILETVRYLQAHTTAGEPVLTYQAGAIINFLANRPQPTRHSYILERHADYAEQSAIIRRLQREHVRYVVHWLPAMDRKPFSFICAHLNRYLQRNYEPVQTYGEFEIRRLVSPPRRWHQSQPAAAKETPAPGAK